ncbi:uncharacterized protein TRAVEDRAFT_26852, partial [Trametes versicolor FP-101664 SS1]|uniref:uncharacterized protein n=1 Tax=Trametes versicolor (strain FP-101664) TaxID=717944 RepID=UPI0004621A08
PLPLRSFTPAHLRARRILSACARLSSSVAPPSRCGARAHGFLVLRRGWVGVDIWNRGRHEYSPTTGRSRSPELAGNPARARSGQVFYPRRSGQQPAGWPPYYKRGATTAPDEEDFIFVDHHATRPEADTDTPPPPIPNFISCRLFLSRQRLGRLGRANTRGGGGAAGDALAQAGGSQEYDDFGHPRARRRSRAGACEAEGPRAPDVRGKHVRGVAVVFGCAAELFNVA